MRVRDILSIRMQQVLPKLYTNSELLLNTPCRPSEYNIELDSKSEKLIDSIKLSLLENRLDYKKQSEHYAILDILEIKDNIMVYLIKNIN